MLNEKYKNIIQKYKKYLEKLNKKNSTIETYSRIAKHYLECINKNNNKIDEIKNIEIFLNNKPYSYKSMLNIFFKYLYEKRIIKKRIDFRTLDNLKTRKLNKELRYIKVEDLDELKNKIMRECRLTQSRDLLIVELLFFTGLNISEMTHLKIEDIYSDHIIVRKERYPDRYIPIPVRTSKMIQEYLEETGNNIYLFENKNNNGNSYSRQAIRDMLYSYSEKFDISLTNIIFRNSFREFLKDNNIPLIMIFQLAGASIPFILSRRIEKYTNREIQKEYKKHIRI